MTEPETWFLVSIACSNIWIVFLLYEIRDELRKWAERDEEVKDGD